MSNLNSIFCVTLTDLWSTAPEYVLLAIIILLHVRMEVKLNNVVRHLVGHFNERLGKMEGQFNERFTAIDKHFTEIDKRFTEIGFVLKDIQTGLKIHDLKINGHEKRLDKIEERQESNTRSKSA